MLLVQYTLVIVVKLLQRVTTYVKRLVIITIVTTVIIIVIIRFNTNPVAIIVTSTIDITRFNSIHVLRHPEIGEYCHINSESHQM